MNRRRHLFNLRDRVSRPTNIYDQKSKLVYGRIHSRGFDSWGEPVYWVEWDDGHIEGRYFGHGLTLEVEDAHTRGDGRCGRDAS